MTSEQKRMKVLLAVLGVLVVGFLAKTFLLGGDDDSTPRSTSAQGGPPPEASLTTPTTAKVKDGSTPTTVAPEEFDVFATRNPFEPAIAGSTSGSEPKDPAPGDEQPTNTGAGASTSSSAPVGDTSSGAATTAATTPTNEPSLVISLNDVFVDGDGLPKAAVTVGTTAYAKLAAGDVFGPASQLRVVSLDMSSGCGQFLFGENPFPLCEGQQILK